MRDYTDVDHGDDHDLSWERDQYRSHEEFRQAIWLRKEKNRLKTAEERRKYEIKQWEDSPLPHPDHIRYNPMDDLVCYCPVCVSEREQYKNTQLPLFKTKEK